MKGLALALAVYLTPLFVAPLSGALIVGCAPAGGAAQTARSPSATALPDVRVAKDRPPVVLVVREGDPSAAIAVAVTTNGLAGAGAADDPEAAVALAGVVEARLAAKGLAPVVVPSWSGFRAALLVTTPQAVEATTNALREALVAPIEAKDVAAAKKKLTALGTRPLPDAALARWARCVGSPYALPARAGKSGDDLVVGRLEAWRAGAHGLGRVAIAVAAPSATAESVASAIARGPAWRAAAPAPALPPAAAEGAKGAAIDVDVYETTAMGAAARGAVVHATLDVGTGSEAVSTAEALGDPHGPLASRLAALDLPFRLREVTAAAEPHGGCVGIVLGATAAAPAAELAARVADAVALVHVEAQVHLAEGGAGLDGRTLARRAGDAREAAERAAWWAIADSWARGSGSESKSESESESGRESKSKSGSGRESGRARAVRGSVVLGVPAGREGPRGAEVAVEPSREALAAAVRSATLSWEKPVAEGRVRVEPGQGEAWVLIASPCGTGSETDADAGLGALVAVAAAEMAKSSPEARVEPWIVPDGIGLLVHGPALPGETSAAQARRLADVVARSFAADTLTVPAVSRARAELLRRDAHADGLVLGVVGSAVAPDHASWFVASGREETLARSADAAVLTRAQALRAGPLRVAVLANVDAAQGDAALRAADRWIDRRVGDARACRAATAPSAPRPGTYSVEPRPGAAPEAYLAFPFAKRDAGAHAAASILAASLDGEGGLLEKALGSAGATGLARASSARVVGWPRAPALVVRVVSTQASLDDAVMQTRALLDRVKKSGLTPADQERGAAAAAREALATALDPRARVVATWRGEAIPSATQPLAGDAATRARDVRAFAAETLGEDAMVVVASRPARVKAAAAP